MPNSWDFAPWLIDGGVLHSASVARLLSFAGFQGQQGILGSKDLQVTAMATPGAGVRVWPGACSIWNRTSGAAYEAYAARLPTIDNGIPIAPTGGVARTDLIVARVEDPFVPNSPWPRPSQAAIDAGTAEFVRSAVISGVDPSATDSPANLGYSCIPLARITLPPNTSVVQQAHITDLRRLTRTYADPPVERTVYPPAARTLSSTSYVSWPSDLAFYVDIPPWATHVQAKAIIGGVLVGPAAMAAMIRLALGTIYFGGSTGLDMVATTNPDRTTIMASGNLTPVPAALRGTQQQARVEAYKTAASSTLVADSRSACSLELTFSQGLETNV